MTWRTKPMDELPSSYEVSLSDHGKSMALSYLIEAFAEAQRDGLDGDCVAQAALFAAFSELVTTYGEEAVATYAEGLPERIRSGAFSICARH